MIYPKGGPPRLRISGGSYGCPYPITYRDILKIAKGDSGPFYICRAIGRIGRDREEQYVHYITQAHGVTPKASEKLEGAPAHEFSGDKGADHLGGKSYSPLRQPKKFEIILSVCVSKY
jgi:hypothetical protein